MKVHPYPKKKQSTNFQTSQREFHHELKRLREIKKFGPLLDRAACQNALTKFQDRVVYVKSNGLNQLDLWDLETHSLLYCFEAAHQSSIYAMTVTSKQNLLLSGSADKSIAVWDLEQKKLAHRFNDAHTDIVTFIVTSSAKKLVAASTSLDRTIAFWDLINMKSEGKIASAHTTDIHALAMTTNGEFLISSGDEIIAVWNTSTKNIHHRFLDAHFSSIYCLAVTPDNQYIASGSADGTIKVWNLRSKALVKEVTNNNSTEVWSITASVITPNQLIIGSEDGSISTWMISEDSEDPPQSYSHGDSKVPICWLFSSTILEGRSIFSVAWDANIIVWDLDNQEEPVEQLIPHYVSDFRGMHLMSDSSHLVFMRPKHLYVWNLHQKKMAHIFAIKEKTEMRTMTLTSDNQTALVACLDHTLHFFDLNSYRLAGSILISHEKSKLSYPRVEVTNDKTKIVYTAKSERYIILLDFASRKEICKFEEDGVMRIALTSDSRYLAAGNTSHTFSLWDLVEMKLLRRFTDSSKHPADMKVMFTPDDKYLMTINVLHSKGLKVWNYKDLTEDEPKPFKILNIPNLSPFASIFAGDLLIWTDRLTNKRNYLNYRQYLSEGSPSSDEKLNGTPLSQRTIYTPLNILSVSKDNTYMVGETKLGLEVWNLTNRTLYYEINELVACFTGESVCISEDSKFLTCLTGDNDIEVWDTEKTTRQHRFGQQVHHMPMSCIAFSPNYKFMVTGCSGGSITVWDLGDRTVKSSIPNAHSDVIKQLLITGDNTKLISLSESGIRIWDLSTYKRLHEISIPNTESKFLSMAYDTDSENLVFSQGKDMIVYNIALLEKIQHRQDAHNGDIKAVIVTPKGIMISGSADGSVAFWNINSKKLPRRLDGIHKGSIDALVCDHDGKYVFSASSDGSIGVIDLEQMTLKYREKSLREKSIKFMTLTPDGQYLVSLSKRGHIGYLKLKQKIFTHEYKNDDTFPIDCLTVTKENKFLIAGKTEGTILVYDLSTHDLVWKQEKAHTGWVRQVAVIENPNFFVSASDDGTVAVWNIEEQTLHTRFKVAHLRAIYEITVIPKTNRVVAGAGSNTITILDAVNKTEIGKISDCHKYYVFHVAVSTDEKTIASVGDDSKVALWKKDKTGKLEGDKKFNYPSTNQVTFVVITPDNQRIIASNYSTVHIWRMDQSEKDSPEELVLKNSMHPESFLLSKDGRYFSAVSALDKSIYIWNLHKKNCFFQVKHKSFKKIRKMTFADDFRSIYCVIGTDIWKINTSFVTNDSNLQVDKIPTLHAIDCLLNPDEYDKKEITEASQALSHYYYLPKGWDFLYFITFMVPNVDSSLIDAAIENQITLSFDSHNHTPLDYLLEFEGKNQQLQKFFAYFFKNISLLVDFKVLDAEKMLHALSRDMSIIKKINKTQTESSFLSYLSCFLLKPKGILFNSQKLPLQGKQTGGKFIELKELAYKKKKIKKTVKDKGKDTLSYHLIALPLSHKIYSPDSLKFIGLMASSDSISFFEAPVVRHLIDFYWQQSKKYLWIWVLIHMVLIGLFTAFAIIKEREHNILTDSLLIAVAGINCILFICEFLQFLSNLSEYFQDPYNFIDLLIISVQFATAAIYWFAQSDYALSFLVSLSILLWYTKLLTLLRIIDQLRRFIRMIFEIIRDGASFTVVIFTYMFAFTTLMYQSRKLSDDDENLDFSSVALETYTFAIGNYDTSNYSGVTMPFFIMGTILMPLILLNMLIALMGNTYNAATENAVAIDTKEKISMISEIASTVIQFRKLFRLLLCRTKRKTSPRYLLVVEPFEDRDENDVTLEEKIRGMIETAVLQIDEKMDELKSEFSEKLMKSMTEKIESQFDKLGLKAASKPWYKNEVKNGIKTAALDNMQIKQTVETEIKNN